MGCRAGLCGGSEDGDSGEGVGEGFHASGAEPGRGGHPEALHGVRQETNAQRDRAQDQGLEQGTGIGGGTDNRYIKAATEALHDTFKKETVFIRCGGSIPIVTDFQDELKIPSVMMGFGLPDDNLHAPNEKFHIPNFHRGIETICLFLRSWGRYFL